MAIPKHLVIYDLETYPNVFTFAFMLNSSDKVHVLECSERKNEVKAMIELIATCGKNEASMVGFNNIGFDYPILHDLISVLTPEVINGSGLDVAKFCSEKCTAILNSKNRWSNNVWEANRHARQLDLYFMNHYDNKSRRTGLKQLEFVMRAKSIQDLPFPVRDLEHHEMDTLIKYNKHDVRMTKMFLNMEDYYGNKFNLDGIDFRDRLSEKYQFSFRDFNDTKIGKQLFIHELERQIGPDICFTRVGRKKIPNQTVRDSLGLYEVLSPKLRLTTDEFETVRAWLSNVTLGSVYNRDAKIRTLVTKDVMTKLDLTSDNPFNEMLESFNPKSDVTTYTHMTNSDGESVYRYRNVGSKIRIKKETEALDGKVTHTLESKVLKNLSVQMDGLKYVFGLGGIHASLDSKIVLTGDGEFILDVDVTSYYTSNAITLEVYPEHLGVEFCDIYKGVKSERLSYEKGTVENASLKLSLNGVYGDSNNPYSPFYDPKFTMAITLNGQLFLAMLVERILAHGGTIIQANTDGITFKGQLSDLETLFAQCKEWELETGLDLEYVPYQSMWIRDVNNYIALRKDGKLKLKGCYEIDRVPHKNHSQLCVAKAAVEHLTTGRPIIDILEDNHDMYDFMFFIKAQRSHRLELWDDGVSVCEVQRNSRFVVANPGFNLKKVMPPIKSKPGVERFQDVKSGHKVIDVNNMNNYDPDEIFQIVDYEYYVAEVEKLCALTPQEVS